MTTADPQEFGLRMLAVGALLVWATSFFLSDTSPRIRAVAVIFCLSLVGFAFNEHAPTRALIGPFSGPLWLLSVAAVGWLAVFVFVLFEEGDINARSLSPAGALTATGLLAWFGPETIKPTIWIVHHILEMAISGYAAWLVLRSWRDDLVDARRQVRAALIGAMGLFAAVLALSQVRVILMPDAPQHRIALAAAFAALTTISAVIFLRPRERLFAGSKRARQQSQTEAGLDTALLARLRVLMDSEQIWRREGLTIGALAQAAGAREHRVRMLINSKLGYRNFASFLNDHRIQQAATLLSDPTNARQTVAALAFDLGYGSLGPFNRAFREAKGMTPTEWRREALAEK